MKRECKLLALIHSSKDPKEAIKIAMEVIRASLAQFLSEQEDHLAYPPAKGEKER